MWAPEEDIPAAVLQTRPHEDQVIAGLGKASSKVPKQAGSPLCPGQGCPVMVREDHNKAENCQILVAKAEGEADWERTTVARVDALDQGCYKPSLLPAKCLDGGIALCRLSSAVRYHVHEVGTAQQDGQEPTRADSSHLLHSPKHFQDSQTSGISKQPCCSPSKRLDGFCVFFANFCLED